MGENALKLSPRAKITYGLHLFKALTKQHHRELLPILEPAIPGDSVVIDVGAHAGQFTKLFSGLVPDGQVYAFEPSTYARSILSKVVRMHSLRNVEIVPLGLSDQHASQTLSIPLKASGSLGYGLSHLGDDHEDKRPTYQETIQLVPLDQFVEEQKIHRVDFIKADIEGWEMRMLAGAEKTIERFKPTLLLEVDDRFLQRAGDSSETVWAFLNKFNYSMEHVMFGEGHNIAIHPVSGPHQGDILCKAA